MYDDRRGKLRPADAYAVGKIIVEDLYAGNRPEHGRRGATTFRKISEMTDGRMSAQALYRCAAIYEMCKKLGLKPTFSNLGMSHLSLMLGLTTAQQKRLVNAAEKSNWSVERLRVETAKLRSARKTRKGRKPLPRCVRAVHQLDRFIDGRESLVEDLEALDEIDGKRAKELMGRVTEVQAQLATLHKALAKAARRR